MLITILTVIYVIACLVMIVTILLQSGQGGGLSAGFGGAGSAATEIFGGRGAGGFLARTTVGASVIYMSLSLGLAYLSSKPQSSLDLSGPNEVQRDQEEEVIEEGTLDIKLEDLGKVNKAAKPAVTPNFGFKKPATIKPINVKPVDGKPVDGKPGEPKKLELKLPGTTGTTSPTGADKKGGLKLGDDKKLKLKLDLPGASETPKK